MAQHHASSRERWRVDRNRGVFGPLQSPADVAAQGFQPADAPMLQAMRERAFVGTAAQVGAKMRALAADYGLTELVVNTWAHDPAARRRSYELLAQEFALAEAVPPSA